MYVLQKYPELAKVSEFGEGPFVYTSNRRRADIEKEKAATAADIAAGKTTRAAREVYGRHGGTHIIRCCLEDTVESAVADQRGIR